MLQVVTFAYLIYLPVSRLAYLRCAMPTPLISYRYIYSVIDHIAVYHICKLSAHTSTATFTNINKHRTSLLSIVLRWWYTGRCRLGCYILMQQEEDGVGVAPRPRPSSDDLTICEAIVTCSKRWRVGCYIFFGTARRGKLVGPQPAQVPPQICEKHT